MTHSAMFETLKERWNLNYVTEAVLRGWVELNKTRPGKGITEEEYTEITGMNYPLG